MLIRHTLKVADMERLVAAMPQTVRKQENTMIRFRLLITPAGTKALPPTPEDRDPEYCLPLADGGLVEIGFLNSKALAEPLLESRPE